MAITLSPTAAEHVRQFIDSSESHVGLRLGVKTSGCSGFAYVTDLTDSISEKDAVFESHGVKVVVDGNSLPMLEGMHIDYRKQGLNEGFEFENPNVKALCGCGESFGV